MEKRENNQVIDKTTRYNEMCAAKNLNSLEEEIQFGKAVAQVEYGDNSLLPEILYFFRDDVSYPEPLKELANRVDSLNASLVIMCLIEHSPDLVHIGKEWLKLHYTTFLDENSVSTWVENLRKSSLLVRATVFALFDEIEQELLDPMTKGAEKFNEEILRALTYIRGAFQEA